MFMVSRGGSRLLCCDLVLKSSCRKDRHGGLGVFSYGSNVKYNKIQYLVVYSVSSKPCKACISLCSGFLLLCFS